jgi:hypothetical protein
VCNYFNHIIEYYPVALILFPFIQIKTEFKVEGEVALKSSIIEQNSHVNDNILNSKVPEDFRGEDFSVPLFVSLSLYLYIIRLH